jgi:hypothetical protein
LLLWKLKAPADGVVIEDGGDDRAFVPLERVEEFS